ncbi:MAG: DUF1552 domain-containing protein [Lentisphaeraceae bacterium]|nr:DUF1552 domain-containing protein [Lentisphaeraceae bacterium]
MNNINRRNFLRGTAGSLVALPWLESFATSNSAKAPVRFGTLFFPNGVYEGGWASSGNGGSFKLSKCLSSLNPLKDKIQVMRNLDNPKTKGNHVEAVGAFLTGFELDYSGNKQSLDYLVSKKIGRDSRSQIMVMGTQGPRQGKTGEGLPISFANTVTWATPKYRIQPQISPRAVFDEIFADTTSAKARKALKTQGSILDLVRQDSKDLVNNSSTADRHKIDEYLTSIRETEKKIQKQLSPSENSWQPNNKVKFSAPAVNPPEQHDLHLKLMIDLMILAFQTNQTKVASLMMSHGFARTGFPFLNKVEGDHHGLSHHKGLPKNIDGFNKVTSFYVENFTYMIRRMSQIDEGGNSLLDNSILLFGSALNDGNTHSRRNLPIILAGSGGGLFNPGQLHQYQKGSSFGNLLYSIKTRLTGDPQSFNGYRANLDI